MKLLNKILVGSLICAALAGCAPKAMDKPAVNTNENLTEQVELAVATNADQYKIIVYYPQCEAALMFKDEGSSNYREVRRELVELGAYESQTPLKNCRIYKKLKDVTWDDIHFYVDDANRVDYSKTRCMYISSRGDQNENIFALHNFPHKYMNGTEMPFRPKMGGYGSQGCVATRDWITNWFKAVKEGTKVEFACKLADIEGDDVIFYKDYYDRFKPDYVAEMIRKNIGAGTDIREIDLSKIESAMNLANRRGGYRVDISRLLKSNGTLIADKENTGN